MLDKEQAADIFQGTHSQHGIPSPHGHCIWIFFVDTLSHTWQFFTYAQIPTNVMLAKAYSIKRHLIHTNS